MQILTKCDIASVFLVRILHSLSLCPSLETKKTFIVMNTAQNTFVYFSKSSQYSQLGKPEINLTKMANVWGNCGSMACYVHDPFSSVAFWWLTHFYFHLLCFAFLGVQKGGREEGSWSNDVLRVSKRQLKFICMYAMCQHCFRAQYLQLTIIHLLHCSMP